MAKIHDGTHISSAEQEIMSDLKRHYNVTLGRIEQDMQAPYMLRAMALAMRDRMMDKWRTSRAIEKSHGVKHVYYLSLEFLLGRSLSNAVKNLNLEYFGIL